MLYKEEEINKASQDTIATPTIPRITLRKRTKDIFSPKSKMAKKIVNKGVVALRVEARPMEIYLREKAKNVKGREKLNTPIIKKFQKFFFIAINKDLEIANGAKNKLANKALKKAM